MAASELNDAVSPSELMEEPPNMSTETAVAHILSWKESLQYTCRKNATLMATPQVVVETIHSLSQSGPMQYHIADVPSQLDSEAISPPGMEDSVMASQTKRDEFVTFIRQQLRDSIVFAEKQQNAMTNSSELATNSKTPFLAMALHPFWTFLFLISFLWNQTSAPLKALAHQLMQIYLQNANDYSEDILDANEPNALPLCLTTSSSSQECEGILKTPGDPVILSALRQRSTEHATAAPSFSSLISPSRLFLQDQVTPDGSGPTNVIWNEPFVSVSLLLEALQYIRNQLYQRRQAYLIQLDPSIDTVISVHAIRKWLHPPVEIDAVSSPSNIKEATPIPSNGSSTERLSSPRSNPLTASIDEANATPVAKFLEQISDSQLEWLLSFITTTTTTAEEPSADKDVCFLQRLDRESNTVSGGSVYILQLPNETIETRLAFYDVRQSIATIQANIAQWESTLSEIQKDILVERQTASTTNPSPKLLRLLQRYKLYRQHKEQGEATLLNLFSVQCSLEHTVQVQQPTVAALQQTKLAMQSLRPKDPDALEELVDEIRELEDNDPLDILCQKETHMDTDEMQQLEEELLELQLQDLPCAPSGFPKANTPSFNENPDVGTDAIQPCT